MREAYALIQTYGKGSITAQMFANKDDAINYAMVMMFGEDWEMQMDDDEWEEQADVLEAYEAFDNLSDDGYYYAAEGCKMYVQGGEVLGS